MVYEENVPGIHEFKEDGDMVEGVLIKVQENVGPQNSALYTLEVNEKPESIWGCAILDQRMLGIKIGEKIRVTFKGVGEASPGKNAPKMFKVEVDRPEAKAEEESESESVPTDEIEL